MNADPTVQYAVGRAPDWWKRRLTRTDLANPSPYNTYRHPGLPPGPIAESLTASIMATVNPPHTKYFYFRHVDGSHGKSIFCTAQQGAMCNAPPQ